MESFYTKLPGRGLVHVEGADRIEFLQNLVTNDLNLLRPGRAVYACLLNAQGKFLHDFFITAGKDFILLDCEGGTRAQDLCRRLNIYRLRADVRISVKEDIAVYAIMESQNYSEIPRFRDSRHPGMGYRSFEKPNMEEKPFEEWDRKRILLTVPDGSRDMVPEKSTLLECNIDKLNGISFEKGCYVGQELTARMHYRGLAKKHLYTIKGENLPASGEEIRIDGKLIGEMRSSRGNAGLALLKDECLDLLKSGSVFLAGQTT